MQVAGNVGPSHRGFQFYVFHISILLHSLFLRSVADLALDVFAHSGSYLPYEQISNGTFQ